MAASKVTDDGQLKIPKAVLEKFGIGPGSEVDCRHTADGSVVIEKAKAAQPLDPDRFEQVRGTANAGFSTDEILAMTRGDG